MGKNCLTYFRCNPHDLGHAHLCTVSEQSLMSHPLLFQLPEKPDLVSVGLVPDLVSEYSSWFPESTILQSVLSFDPMECLWRCPTCSPCSRAKDNTPVCKVWTIFVLLTGGDAGGLLPRMREWDGIAMMNYNM